MVIAQGVMYSIQRVELMGNFITLKIDPSLHPLENAPAEPLDESKAPMGTNPSDADLNGGK